MSIVVQKFGGTSVKDISCIENVAKLIKKTCQQGHKVVAVVSAMSGETNRLVDLYQQLKTTNIPREIDVLLSTGEQVTISLLSMALIKHGQPAISLTGSQVKIITDNRYGKANITDIKTERIFNALNKAKVVVIAGFQGVDSHDNITTLGRGGSDTTAVALAAALKAKECQIYTDVEGVYTTDPRIVPEARLMKTICFEEMLEMASLGSKVLQIHAVEFCGKYKVPLRVLSTFKPGEGTLITLEERVMHNKSTVSGIASNRDEAKLSLLGVPDQPGVAAKILGPISDANIEVDMIIQNISDHGNTDFTFTVHRKDYKTALDLLKNIKNDLSAKEVKGDKNIVKLSIVGVGMRSHAGTAKKMFDALAVEDINIQMISTSEIKISIVIEEKYLELGVRTLHKAFGLEKK